MQQTDELFSALLDGELASDDIDALIKTLDNDPKSARAATRWSCIGVMMRGRCRVPARSDLLEGVREAIATEAAEQRKVVPLASRRHSRARRWALPVTGLAAAASIAIAAVVVPVVWQGDAPAVGAEGAPVIAGSGLFSDAGSTENRVAQANSEMNSRTVSVGSLDGVSSFPVGDERLNTYYIEYAGHRSAQGIGGPLGYARYAAHNADLSNRTR